MVEEIQPRAVMMENVPGLANKGRRLYDDLKRRLQELGYLMTDGVLEVADFGVPQFRKRLVLFAGQGFELDIPNPSQSKGAAPGPASWRTVRDAIAHLGEPLTLVEAKNRGPVQESDWHVVRSLSEENAKRIRAAKAGKTWTSIPEDLRPDCHKGSYQGFTNVYGRMAWDQPSPTITGGCTTLSKGRFGHPDQDRTISVREAATLQTFPKSSKFDTPFMESVCNLIGNALPCDFAEIMSRQCHERISMARKERRNGNRARSTSQ